MHNQLRAQLSVQLEQDKQLEMKQRLAQKAKYKSYYDVLTMQNTQKTKVQ